MTSTLAVPTESSIPYRQATVCEDPRRLSPPPITLSPGSPQGCVLSPLLFALLAHDCSVGHPSCLMVTFADDTAVVGLITKNDESNYRQQVEQLEG